MIKLKKESPEVFYSKQKNIIINKKIFDFLRKKSKLSPKKIVRLCVHKSKKDKIHEMFIIFPKNYFCLPHKHPSEESLLVIKGLADIIIFTNSGKIKKIIKMGDLKSGRIFFHKFKRNTIHLLIVRSKFLYFKEVTKGPFTKKNMTQPKWCPKNKKEELDFYKNIQLRLKKIKDNSHIFL
tara:strand:+ start:5281 stop:5820 length:540 start_codon:yes stop_codon:yes gene_type:complete